MRKISSDNATIEEFVDNIKSKPTKTLRILDIDLDFFLENIHYGAFPWRNKRISNDKYKPWSKEKVVSFLEVQCGLLPEQKINGACFIHHDKLFHVMNQIKNICNEVLRFSIDHIDGHSDLGGSDSGLLYICRDLLFHPPDKRSFLQHRGMRNNLDSGNFLAFAAACRLIERLNFITHPGKGKDIPSFIFKNFDINSNLIQLKKFSRDQINEFVDHPDHLPKLKPLGSEPEIPFRMIPYNEFQSSGDYDFVFLAQSPAFTPVEADRLIPVITKYIHPIMGDELKDLEI